MVQRKVPVNRFGIQGGHDNPSDKQLGNSKSAETSQYQNSKSRGGHDFKKVLKKSRSVKLSDKHSSRLLSALKPDKTLSGKSSPAATTTTSAKAATMQPKQSTIKTSLVSPNYMKSTSSSDARMERIKAITTSSNENKSSSQKKSTKTTSLKPMMKSLTRLPSLRGLKKSPSFKLVRSVAKEGSKDGVCVDKEVQRATCSSTLKDSKFPGYLMLHPGRTESDGTSIWKVCTYKYCSLNGHFRAPLPPLKPFLSAKRRLLKAEKVMKLEASTKPVNELIDRPNSSEEEDYHQVNDGGTKFFIEVHDGSCMDHDLEDRKQIECIVKMDAFDDIMMVSIGNLDKGGTKEYDEQDAESVTNRSPHFEIDYDDDQHFDIVSAGINSSIMFLHEESIEGDEDEEEKQHVSGEMNGPDPAFDMEWEEGQHIEPCFDKYDLGCAKLRESENPVKSEYKLDCGSSTCSEEIMDDEVTVQDELDLDSDLEVESKGDERFALLASEVSKTTPTDEVNRSEIASASMEGPGGEANAFSDEKNTNDILSIRDPAPEVDNTNCSTVISDEPSFVKDQEQVLGTDTEVHVSVQTRFVEQQSDGVVEKYGVNEVDADEYLIAASFVIENQILNTNTEDAMEKIYNLDESELMSNMPTNDQPQDFPESALEYPVADGDNDAIQDCQDDANAEDFEPNQYNVDEASCNLIENHEDIEDPNQLEKDNTEPCKSGYPYDADSGESGISDQNIGNLAEDNEKSDAAKICLSVDTSPRRNVTLYARATVNVEEQADTSINLKLTIGSKKRFLDGDEERSFNPHEPNYLPLTPDPETEKVDLRHQTEDERKNAEEWMLDYALRQAVTKLTPARSKRVALLVEAFETVKPKPKF